MVKGLKFIFVVTATLAISYSAQSAPSSRISTNSAESYELRISPYKQQEVSAVYDEEAFMQCYNQCQISFNMDWAQCAANGAPNPTVEACRQAVYFEYSDCVGRCQLLLD